MKKIILFYLTTLFLSSCIKDSSCIKEFVYNETYCSDPWVNNLENFNDEEVKAAVEEYLNENRIRIQKIVRFQNSELIITCHACSCTSGNYLVIKAKEKFTDALDELGFILNP